MVQTSYLLLLITLGLTPKLTVSEQERNLLPTNVKIQICPALIQVTWDCNITESMKKYQYSLYFNAIDKPLNISACEFTLHFISERQKPIHNGLTAEIRVMNNSKIINHTTLSVLQEGNNNTAAENFSCVLYVTDLNCSWTAGKEAPEDARYSLLVRHGRSLKSNLPCEDYAMDSYGRQVGCFWKSPNIKFSSQMYMEVTGRSNKTLIQFFDTFLRPIEHITFDPPRNIRVNLQSNEVEITWQSPKIYNDKDSHWFTYIINASGDIKTTTETSYKMPRLSEEKLTVSMRAIWRQNSDHSKMSRWSDPIVIDQRAASSHLTSQNLLLVLGILTATVLFILIFLCHRFRIWKRLFPKVPQPAMKFFEQAEQKELLEQDISTLEDLQKKYDDDDDCICSPITEISQKDQSETITA